MAAADAGLSGHSVRGIADSAQNAMHNSMQHQPASGALSSGLEETIHSAAEHIIDGLNLAGKALGQAVDVASEHAFESAARGGTAASASGDSIGTLGQTSFSWGGYLQAVGILFVLLAALWFVVWIIRKYGKFNFLPRPGSLPRGSLLMEAQMPLGPRKGLVVVRFLNKRLLLGVTDQQISLLTEEEAEHAGHDRNFQGLMEAARRNNANSDRSSSS